MDLLVQISQHKVLKHYVPKNIYILTHNHCMKTVWKLVGIIVLVTETVSNMEGQASYTLVAQIAALNLGP